MCVKPSAKYCQPISTRVSGGSGAASETGSLGGAADDPLRLDRTVADPDVQRVGAEREAVAEGEAGRAAGNRAAEPHDRRRLREIAEGRRRQVLEGGRSRPAVERDADPSRNTLRERRNPPIALGARQVARDRTRWHRPRASAAARPDRRRRRSGRRRRGRTPATWVLPISCALAAIANSRATHTAITMMKARGSIAGALAFERRLASSHRRLTRAASIAAACARMSASLVPVRSACAIAWRAARCVRP